jgi:hypothetical protein
VSIAESRYSIIHIAKDSYLISIHINNAPRLLEIVRQLARNAIFVKLIKFLIAVCNFSPSMIFVTIDAWMLLCLSTSFQSRVFKVSTTSNGLKYYAS